MKRKNKYLSYLICLLVLLDSFSSCKKMVEVDPPYTRLVTATVFDNNSTATAAQLAVYAQMVGSFSLLHRNTGLSSDELTNYSTNQTSKNLYLNSLTAALDGGAAGPWPTYYNLIYQENSLLLGLEKSSGVSERVKNQLKGEAYFMRAYLYFWLVNLYGDVPVTTSIDYTLNQKLSRTPASKVYEFITDDLLRAEGLLSDIYVDATDTVKTNDRVRPNSWTATALLARVYLYRGKNDSAELKSSRIIANNTLYKLPADLTQVFLKNSSEAILQSIPNSNDKYTADGLSYYILTSPPGPTGNGQVLANTMLDAFETGDKRKQSWVKSYTLNNITWYVPYKHRDVPTTTTQTEYTMIFRLAEQHLIRAEARLKQDKLNDAIDDINLIRIRAGVLPLLPGLTKAQILLAIAHERQTELFAEGDRWIDLKRTGAVDSVMTRVTPLKGTNTAWKSYQQLYPISLIEIQNDANLQQTPGY